MSCLVESHRGLGQIEFEGQRLPVRYLYLVSSSEERGNSQTAVESIATSDARAEDVSGALWLLSDGNLANMSEGVLREDGGRALSIQVRSCSHLGGTASYRVTGEVSD